MLAADVPDLQVDGGVGRREGDGGDILADGGDGFEVGVGGGVSGFYLFEEGGFPGVVEAEEEDGVFWGREGRVSLCLRWVRGWEGRSRGTEPKWGG